MSFISPSIMLLYLQGVPKSCLMFYHIFENSDNVKRPLTDNIRLSFAPLN